MSDIEWTEVLGWGQEHLEELRLTAYAYVRQGKYETALKLTKALTALSPNHAYDWQLRGATELELGKTEEALASLSMALKLEPNHIPSLVNQCKALLILGHREEGLRIARFLKKNKDPRVANMASALILAYT